MARINPKVRRTVQRYQDLQKQTRQLEFAAQELDSCEREIRRVSEETDRAEEQANFHFPK